MFIMEQYANFFNRNVKEHLEQAKGDSNICSSLPELSLRSAFQYLVVGNSYLLVPWRQYRVVVIGLHTYSWEERKNNGKAQFTELL